MARSHGVVKVAIWQDPDFRALTARAQRAYFMLLSQPQINNCGVIPLTPTRWARYASDETPATLDQALGELEQARFILVDQDAAELLIRTFIRHDSIEKQPNLVTAAKREYEAIESTPIRDVLDEAFPQLFQRGSERGSHEGVPVEGVSEGVPTRGGRASPAPSPTSDPPTGDLDPTAADNPARDAAAAELLDQLQALGLNGALLNQAQAEPERARAWLTKARDGAITNPAGYWRQGFETQQWPSNVGVSVGTPDPREKTHPYLCEHCIGGMRFKTQAKLDEHQHNVHDEPPADPPPNHQADDDIPF